MFLHCYCLVFVAYTLDFIRLTWQAIRVFTTQDKIKLFEHVKLFSAFVNWKEFSRNGNKIDKFLAAKKRFLAKYFHFKTCHVILRSLSCMYTASCTRNLQTDKMLRELDRLKILLSFCTRCCTIFLAGKVSKTVLFNFLPKMLPGETLCKMVQIFPPKVLVYIRKVFLDTI